MRRLNVLGLGMGLLLSAAPVAQADSVAVVAVGQCDGASGIAARSFRSALTQKMGSVVQTEVDTARPFGGLSDKTVAQINGAVASARSDFYSDKPNDAARTLQAALDDCTRIAPSDSRWQAEREVLTLLAQVQVKANQASAEATMMRIYRVEPEYRPDSSLFPPSFQRFADSVRKAAKKRALVRFEVTTSPAGKPVYVGGKRVGVGPLTLRVPAGEYRVEVDWGHRGLARVVTVPSAPVELSAVVEGAVFPDGGPCIAAGQDVFTALTRVAPLLSATRLYGVHIDTVGDSNVAVVTSVDGSGSTLQEAQVRLQSGAPSSEALGLLAGYAATGGGPASVEVTQPPGSALVGAAAVPAVIPGGGVGPTKTASAAPAPAPAAEPYNTHATRFEAVIRVGFSIPLGNAVAGGSSATLLNGATALSDYASFILPVGVDLGVRIGGVVFIGGYFQYGLLGSPNSANCVDNTGAALSCSSNTVNVGGEVLIHPLGSAKVDPWFGVGSGFEWLNVSASNGTVSASGSYSGWQFFNLQLGVDFAVGSVARVGPYASFAMGQYSSESVAGTSASIGSTAVHEWISLGVRLVILP